MKVLVTGGCGFLGFHIAMHFRAKGGEVIAYDSLDKAARDYNRRELARNRIGSQS
jgi:nucleoside-diphosphate-sugar epimerase